MNNKKLKELLKLSEETEKFLLYYASGKYGKVKERIDVTEKVVKKFMKLSNEDEMKEVISYTEFIDEMLSEKDNGDGGGDLDLEEYIEYIINKEKYNHD